MPKIRWQLLDGSIVELPAGTPPPQGAVLAPEDGGGDTYQPTQTQTFDGPQGYGRYQYNPQTQKYDTFLGGAEQQTNQAPQIEYGPDGRAFSWDFINGQPFRRYWPELDDPTRAAGYQAPRQASPQYPTTEITANGDIYTVNPYTGIPEYVGNDPRLASPDFQTATDARTGRTYAVNTRTGERIDLGQYDYAQPSPEELRQQQQADAEAGRAFNTGERVASQVYGTGEREAGQAFQAGESALGRALQAGQFAAQLAGQNQERAFSADQAYQQAQERYTQQQLGAAQQVADNISNVDQGALPAFYAAGGGVISNALAGGATAQTDMANFGSARALRLAENAAPPERFAFTPVSFDASQYGQPSYTAGQGRPQQPGLVAGQDFPGVQGARDIAYSMGSGMTVEDFEKYKAGIDAQGTVPASMPSSVYNSYVPGMADGGVGNMAVVGEEGPELVMGGPFMVMNEEQLGVDPMKMRAPRAADGGAFGFDINSVVLPSDQPYIDRIRRVRSGVDTSNPLGVGPFNTRFNTLAPSLRNRYFAAQQTKYGVPAEDVAFEEQRFRVPGGNRGAFQLAQGY